MHSPVTKYSVVTEINLVKEVTSRSQQSVHRGKSRIWFIDLLQHGARDNKIKLLLISDRLISNLLQTSAIDALDCAVQLNLRTDLDGAVESSLFIFTQHLSQSAVNLNLMRCITCGIEPIQTNDSLRSSSDEFQCHAEIIAKTQFQDCLSGKLLGAEARVIQIILELAIDISQAFFRALARMG